jgi:hypothetical protein
MEESSFWNFPGQSSCAARVIECPGGAPRDIQALNTTVLQESGQHWPQKEAHSDKPFQIIQSGRVWRVQRPPHALERPLFAVGGEACVLLEARGDGKDAE